MYKRKGGFILVTKELYGTTSTGEKVYGYSLSNQKDSKIFIIEYGCRIVNWFVPDLSGNMVDIVFGCKDLQGYEQEQAFLGAFVGRFANRIEQAKFCLDGKEYQLEANNGRNHNHGVWHQKVFKSRILPENGVEFFYTSPDGEDGFPGNVAVSVRCVLTENNQLVLDYTACSDAATPINLTNHSYFNLDGKNSNSVLNHKLQIFADTYTPSDEFSCPTGSIESVKDTPMDFTQKHLVGSRIQDSFTQIQKGNGYDHNYIINRSQEGLAKAARLEAENSGIWLECETTQPGVQLYTANGLQDEGVSKEGFVHSPWSCLCLETQNFPCATNRPNFPNSILRPGELYRHTTVYTFGI